jgi:hypothetical protein
VVCWVVIRRSDRDEMRRLLELQDAAIARLRDELNALRQTVAVKAPESPAAAVVTPPVAATAKPIVAPTPVASPAVSSAPVPPAIPVADVRPPTVAATSVQPKREVTLVAPMPPVSGDPIPAGWRPKAEPVVPVTGVARSLPVDAAEAEQRTPPPMFRESLAEGNQKGGQSKRSLEQTLGTNWLNRLGVVLLVFGVALYMAYRVTHFGPVGKVLTAYGLSAVLLGGGLWLERKERYRIFARAGIGGGWALTFLTTYGRGNGDALAALPVAGGDGAGVSAGVLYRDYQPGIGVQLAG